LSFGGIWKCQTTFRQLPGAILDHGPDHPLSPDAEREREVEAYFRRYPFLLADSGYVAFVRRYLWAGTEGDNVGIHVYAPVSEVYDPYWNNPLDEEGFFTFATSEYWLLGHPGRQNNIALGFGFDSTGDHRKGVYRSAMLASREQVPWSWYCETFAEWLERIIQRRGQLLD
jgi:hypothetical protein